MKVVINCPNSLSKCPTFCSLKFLPAAASTNSAFCSGRPSSELQPKVLITKAAKCFFRATSKRGCLSRITSRAATSVSCLHMRLSSGTICQVSKLRYRNFSRLWLQKLLRRSHEAVNLITATSSSRMCATWHAGHRLHFWFRPCCTFV